MEERSLETWAQFEETVEDIRREHVLSADQDRSPLLFRGQENSCWSLRTTLDRWRERMPFGDYYRIIDRIQPQIESLTRTEWPIPPYPEVERATQDYDQFSKELLCGRCPGYAYMAYLRHHGFPSPLLDWTRSPYIAAFFAFSKANEDSQGRVAVYVLSGMKLRLSGNRMPVLYRYGPYVRTHRRHVLQQSEYTLCTGFDDTWYFERYDTIFDPGHRQQSVCWKITLPATERLKALNSLDERNLNAFSLFETEESLMETLATREFSSRL